MKFLVLTPMLESNDMPGTIDFYVNKLGFTLENKLEFDGQIAWASLIRDSIAIMFKTPNQVMNYGTILLTGNLYIHCDDAPALWELLRLQAPVVYELEAFNYGMTEFAIKDNNGYVLSFGSETKTGE